MPRPSQKSKILQAALECFAEKGFAGTRIKDIAERAEVTEGALYKHYQSKEELAQALALENLRTFIERLLSIVNSTELGVRERFQALIQMTLDSYRENPAGLTFVLLRQPVGTLNMPPDLPYPIEVVEKLIQEGQSKHLVRTGQLNVLAAIFLGCVLRPIIVSQAAAPGALDLIHDTQHDQLIQEAAWRAISE